MASGFAPEFLILLGIDIFLGASILTVLLDRHFPTAFPYVLEGAALIGFAELMSGPTFLTSLSNELQFWYSFIYAMIAVLSLFATNLYLLFLRRRAFESAILGICGTVPAGLGILYFTSAFVNGLSVNLPLIPVIPIEGVYAMFGLSIGLVVFSLVVFGRRVKSSEPVQERETVEPIITRATGAPDQLTVMEGPENPRAASQSPPDGQDAESSPVAARPAPEAAENNASPEKGPPMGPPSSFAISNAAAQIAPAAPKDEDRIQGDGTVLVKKVEKTQYARRLLDSIRFFERAVDHPLKFDPRLVEGTVPGARKAYLTPAGMLMIEDSTGKMVSLSIMDISTEEALKVMKEAMKGIDGRGVPS